MFTESDDMFAADFDVSVLLFSVHSDDVIRTADLLVVCAERPDESSGGREGLQGEPQPQGQLDRC